MQYINIQIYAVCRYNKLKETPIPLRFHAPISHFHPFPLPQFHTPLIWWKGELNLGQHFWMRKGYIHADKFILDQKH